MKRLKIKDHSLTKLAEMGKEDVMHSGKVSHLERGDPLENTGEDCELRQLRRYIQHIRLFHTECGPLIMRDSSTVLIPETYKACQDCKRESASKPVKAYNVAPPDLLQITPAEEISIDFMSYGYWIY